MASNHPEYPTELYHGKRLAEYGASPNLIDKLTTIGRRDANRLCDYFFTSTDEKPITRRGKTEDWLLKHLDRQINAQHLIKLYEFINRQKPRIERIVEVYEAYLMSMPSPNLTVDEVANIIELFENNGFMQRFCSSCGEMFHTPIDEPECPYCRSVEGVLCEHCGEPFTIVKTYNRGRKRRLCDRKECISSRPSSKKKPSSSEYKQPKKSCG